MVLKKFDYVIIDLDIYCDVILKAQSKNALRKVVIWF